MLVYVSLLISFSGFSQLTEKNIDILRQELSQHVNELRESKGLNPLVFNDTLRKAAQFHSEYMVQSKVLSHDQRRFKYSTPKRRVYEFEGTDFELIGENVLYSTPQDFPLNKKALISLAEEMFNSWKNSPGHYANMINPKYIFGDFGFKTDRKKNIVYATQVFGKKGYKIENQLSNNSFGLREAHKNCENDFKELSNIIMNFGNNITFEGDEVVFYYSNISFFKKIFSGPRDGIAIDLIAKDQLLCGNPNRLDVSLIHDGVLLKPIYASEMLTNNRAKGDYRVITKVGDIPKGFNSNDYSPSIVLIKDGKACKYIYPVYVPRQNYELGHIEPIINDESTTKLVNNGIIQSQLIKYNFETNISQAIGLPKLADNKAEIHSIQINSYSSVEGDSVQNIKLYNARAAYIKKHISGKLGTSANLFRLNTKENWGLMNFQLNYFNREDLTQLSQDSLRKFLVNRDTLLPWDSLFYSQREAVAVINYSGTYSKEDSIESLAEFNVRTAAVIRNVSLMNKALFELYSTKDFNPSVLFEPQVVDFIKSQPKTVTNYLAVLSNVYFYSPYSATDFVFYCLERESQLGEAARFNLKILYTRVGTYLLGVWDVPSKRLSNVIHPQKIENISSQKEPFELILNLNLTYIRYYGQVNDTKNISKSFDFIAAYFKENAIDQNDDVDLALFFNYWSMYKMSVEYLLNKFKNNNINEEGLFTLAHTMNMIDFSENDPQSYNEVHIKAVESNPTRWCNMVENDFQIKRNLEIKNLYCEICE